MQNYLFVHFREKATPDGEQVYFALSQDGFHWEEINGGRPVLWSFLGEKGVRDFSITRVRESGKFIIFATDLSLAYGMKGKYQSSWEEVSRNGSRMLSVWESDDLVNWSEQRLVQVGTRPFSCVWAPDVIYDSARGGYLLHWSSAVPEDGFSSKKIYGSRTRDFVHFTEPEVIFEKEGRTIDSAIYEEDGSYYMFAKSEQNPQRIIMLRAPHPEGPYTRMPEFDSSMDAIEDGKYEAPTAVRLDDGRWCLFLDYYGVPGAGQGYVPFVADSLASGKFVRADESFSFPYGFKHGSILTITPEEYARVKKAAWD